MVKAPTRRPNVLVHFLTSMKESPFSLTQPGVVLFSLFACCREIWNILAYMKTQITDSKSRSRTKKTTVLSKGAVNTEHASGFSCVQMKYVAVPLKKAKTQRKTKETMTEGEMSLTGVSQRMWNCQETVNTNDTKVRNRRASKSHKHWTQSVASDFSKRPVWIVRQEHNFHGHIATDRKKYKKDIWSNSPQLQRSRIVKFHLMPLSCHPLLVDERFVELIQSSFIGEEKFRPSSRSQRRI